MEVPDPEAPVSSKKYTLMHEYKETGRHGAWIRWVVEDFRRFFTVWCTYLQRRSYISDKYCNVFKLWCMSDSHESLLSLKLHHPPPHWKCLTHCRGCRGARGERLFLGNVDSILLLSTTAKICDSYLLWPLAATRLDQYRKLSSSERHVGNATNYLSINYLLWPLVLVRH